MSSAAQPEPPELALGMVFIAHDPRRIRQLCDTVAVMYLGRIVERRPTAEIFAAANRDAVLLEGDPPDPPARPTGRAFRTRCSNLPLAYADA